MYRNLEAEQARKGMTNEKVAEYLNLSRTSYEKKKKTGRFVTKEITLLCKLFECSFDYLFATADSDTKAV